MPEQTEHRIWSTILAAGISSRMGKPKLSLPWGERTILEETTHQVMEGGYDGVVVVVGDPTDALDQLLVGHPVKVARNLNYRAGMCTSIKAGVAFIDPDATAFALVPGSQPRIGSKMHQLVQANFRKSGKGICAPLFEGKLGYPVIFSAKYRSEMFALQGDHGVQNLIELHKDDLYTFEVKTPEVVQSINTLKDYEELRPKK